LLAGLLNKFYIRDRITATLLWCPAGGYYGNLLWSSTGLISTNTPWSGYYEVKPATWAVAHTTQFAEPGWQYMDAACGYFSISSGGNYVTLRHPNGKDYSVVIYTGDEPEKMVFHISGGLSTGPVHIWKSDRTEQFVRQADIEPESDSFSISFNGGSIYTLTTTTGQQKGKFEGRVAKKSDFPLPFAENFDGTAIGRNPKYFADIHGAFEVIETPQSKDRCVCQKITTAPIDWESGPEYKPQDYPMTQFGDTNWTDYEISTKVRFEDKGFGTIFARVGQIPNGPSSYALRLHSDGRWELLLDNKRVFDAGVVSIESSAWTKVKLTCRGNTIIGMINEKEVGRVSDKSHRQGLAGLGSSWNRVLFDEVSVKGRNRGQQAGERQLLIDDRGKLGGEFIDKRGRMW
jgi:Glycosyl hydrolase family 59.